jgi:hypothetical protein
MKGPKVGIMRTHLTLINIQVNKMIKINRITARIFAWDMLQLSLGFGLSERIMDLYNTGHLYDRIGITQLCTIAFVESLLLLLKPERYYEKDKEEV